MKKLFIIVIILLLFLSSCGKKEIIVKVEKKKDFLVSMKSFKDFGKESVIKKVATLKSSQNIQISSNATGRVKGLYVKQGDRVRAGNILARLDDSIASYGINLERARNALEKAKINYSKINNSLTKGIGDLNVNLDNLKIDSSNSSSALNLEKINNSIKKLQINYDNLILSDKQTKIGFNVSIEKKIDGYKIFTSDLITFADELLSVTSKNRDTNRNYRNYLGAKDTNQKRESENLLRELIAYNNISYLKSNFKSDLNNIKDYLKFITSGYKKSNNLLDAIQQTLDNSISSVGTFSTITITTNKGLVNNFQSTSNINNSGFIGLKNSINQFLATYKNNENSLLKQIELLKSDKKIYVQSLDTKFVLGESSLGEAISNKELTLKNADRLIVDARISYKEALKQYNKLTIKSPISGIIGNIFISIGQELNIGMPAFSISNSSNNELIIYFNENELNLIHENMRITVDYNGKKLTGYIYSISKIADSNLKYASKIKLDKKINLLGSMVNINIPVKLNTTLLPINFIKIENNNKGIINVLNNLNIEKKEVSLGKIYGDKIEIKDTLSGSLQIITNFVDNFDKTKFNIKLK